jgi:phage tail sheath gpL-like
MPENIIFSYIPANIRTPGVYAEYNLRNAVQGLLGTNWQTLLIAQMLASGSALALTPTQVFQESDAMAYFGVGSQAHLMARAALEANRYLQLTVIGVSDAGGAVAATGTITITGPATAAGIISIFVSDEEIDVNVNNTDTAIAIAGNIVSALNNMGDLPVIAWHGRRHPDRQEQGHGRQPDSGHVHDEPRPFGCDRDRRGHGGGRRRGRGPEPLHCAARQLRQPV